MSYYLSVPGSGWEETFIEGNPDAEAKFFEGFARDIQKIQARNQSAAKSQPLHRALHAKVHLGVANAQFVVNKDIPDYLQHGLFQPGRKYQTDVRFSNASGLIQPDFKPDLRGLALRVVWGEVGDFNDFLMSNASTSHANTAQQFMEAAKAGSGSQPRFFLFKVIKGIGIILHLFRTIGLAETRRMIRTLGRDRRSPVRGTFDAISGKKPIESLATESYWSRGPFLLGKSALQFYVAPATGQSHTSLLPEHRKQSDYLRLELEKRLSRGDIVFDFKVKLFDLLGKTPIEEGAVEWQTMSEDLTIAQLIIPQTDPVNLSSPEALEIKNRIEQTSFNPWNGAGAKMFRPLGQLNRARNPVYVASAAYRENHGAKPQSNCPFFKLVEGISKLLGVLLAATNRVIPWHRWGDWLPILGVINLVHIREQMRKRNLHDTETIASRESYTSELDYYQQRGSCPVMPLVHRMPDGRWNDLSQPQMGQAGSRFGRNTPLSKVPSQWKPGEVLQVGNDPHRLLEPNPRKIAQALMTRTQFKPATTLNLLAAAWIQFMIHDWFFHRVDDKGTWIEFPPLEGENGAMKILPTEVAPCQQPQDYPIAYANRETQWWDGSQIYGSTLEIQKQIRLGEQGKLKIQDGPHYLLPQRESPVATGSEALEVTGVPENWWLGMGLLHSLFTLEHNAICDRLIQSYPHWSDEQLFQTARLINAALLAKIHTVEWTPGILAHPSIKIALEGNWWGILGERINKVFGRVTNSEVFSGILGGEQDHHGVPFSFTEEFTSVYRLHPLLPDDLVFQSISGQPMSRTEATLSDVTGEGARTMMSTNALADLLYSFGLMHPGAIVLNNYPNALRQNPLVKHIREDGTESEIDLAAVEIFRDRERGVPRYNAFREMLNLHRINSFEELTPDRNVARQIQQLYNNKIDDVDLMVGLFAEAPPKGFGFSDTAFRIFILMASRRLNSDRFFTTDFTPTVYSPEGIKWIQDSTMRSVLIRHFPELASALRHSQNAFAPWDRV